jgi:hypothetical protein
VVTTLPLPQSSAQPPLLRDRPPWPGQVPSEYSHTSFLSLPFTARRSVYLSVLCSWPSALLGQKLCFLAVISPEPTPPFLRIDSPFSGAVRRLRVQDVSHAFCHHIW